MADDRTRRRRRSRRRRIVVIAVTLVVVAAGAGTAWAVSGSDGPSYRVATVTRASITQTVDADGTLTSQDTATQSFSAAGTVDTVQVRTGERVTAGQTLATLDRSSLTADVTSARTTLARARQTLADDEAGQTSTTTGQTSGGTATSTGGGTTTGTTITGTTAGATTDAAISGTGRNSIVLVADVSPTGSMLAKAEAAVRTAQKEVVAAQSSLDGYVTDLTSACTTSGTTETTQRATADASGSVSGTVDAAAVVTVAADTTTSNNPQTVASGGSWTFAGLTAAQTYSVVVVPVVDGTACTQAIGKVQDAEGTTSSTSPSTLYGSLDDLTDAITNLEKVAASSSGSGSGTGSGSGSGTGSGSGSGSSTGSGSGSGSGSSSGTGSGSGSGSGSNSDAGTGSGSGTKGSGTTGSGSTPGTGSTAGRATSGSTAGGATSDSTAGTSGSSTTTTTVSAAHLAADQKSIDAAKAALAVARNDMDLATLTSPISGTVASVGITAGSSVSASSTSDTIVVTTDKALSIPVDVSLADIDLIKVGETASVTVDGRTEPLAATVSMIGLSNASSSTGSSSEYQVTLVLDERAAKLYDGMGASVAIGVGTARNAVTVPVSAVTTTGNATSVRVESGGIVTTTRVTLGVEGDSRVQVTDGLKVGDEVVLADLDEALPSSDSSTTTGSSLTGGTFGGGTGRGAGGPPGGGR